MSPTQLNPDAWRQGLGVFKRSYYDDDDSRAKCFENGLRAYFAAVHPVVNSVEDLESEALELFNTLHGTEYSKWHEVSLMPEGDRRDWLAVARKAREMAKEATK